MTSEDSTDFLPSFNALFLLFAALFWASNMGIKYCWHTSPASSGVTSMSKFSSFCLYSKSIWLTTFCFERDWSWQSSWKGSLKKRRALCFYFRSDSFGVRLCLVLHYPPTLCFYVRHFGCSKLELVHSVKSYFRFEFFISIQFIGRFLCRVRDMEIQIYFMEIKNSNRK